MIALVLATLTLLLTGSSVTSTSSASASASARYGIQFRPAPGDSTPAIVVELTYIDGATRTRFHVPFDWADQRELYKALDSIQLRSAGTLLLDSLSAGFIEVLHEPRVPITLRYRVRQDWTGAIRRETYFRPIIQRDWFLVLGHNALIVPDDNVLLDAELAWDVEGVIGNSFDVGSARQRLRVSTNQLRNAVFAGGNLRLLRRTEGATRVSLLTIPAARPFSDSAFLRRATRVFVAERAFWKETAGHSQLVTLLPSVNDMGGTRYENAMALFVDPRRALDATLTSLVAHETFHEWLGGRMEQPSGDAEATMKWFAEGFTDYYGDRILRDAGLMSASEYAEATNRVIREYFVSPARDAPRDVVAQEYWRNPAMNRLPYQRGRLFALRLDAEIRRATAGRRSLDDLMRVLLRLIPDSMTMSDANIAMAGRRVAGNLVATEIDTYIGRGQTIVFPDDALGPCFRVDSTSVPVFELGFDLAASRASKVIAGVQVGTRAYDAGLRDGQQLRGLNLYNGDATKDATITVADSVGERKITYRPAKLATQTIPVFVAKGCEARP